MADGDPIPFIGEIRLFSFNYAPSGWATCDGQLVGINQNPRLYSLIKTLYGGDGVTNFRLPDLRGRVGMKMGPVHKTPGEVGGEEGHTLLPTEMPLHQHTMMASGTAANVPVAQGSVLAVSANNPYGPAPATPVALNTDTIPSVGGTPHDNMQPFLTINFAIAMVGIMPPTD